MGYNLAHPDPPCACVAEHGTLNRRRASRNPNCHLRITQTWQSFPSCRLVSDRVHPHPLQWSVSLVINLGIQANTAETELRELHL
jgi:hypothetical protein